MKQNYNESKQQRVPSVGWRAGQGKNTDSFLKPRIRTIGPQYYGTLVHRRTKGLCFEPPQEGKGQQLGAHYSGLKMPRIQVQIHCLLWVSTWGVATTRSLRYVTILQYCYILILLYDYITILPLMSWAK